MRWASPRRCATRFTSTSWVTRIGPRTTRTGTRSDCRPTSRTGATPSRRRLPARTLRSRHMRSPVSSRLCLVFQEALEGAVFGGVVVDAVLPAVPDDGEPGAGKDADGVWVVVASGSGAPVEVGGPRVGSAGVAGEVADGVAQLFVAGPTEADGAYFAGLAGRGGDTGQAHQRLGGGELGAAVADFGEQSGSADAAGAGQAGEDVRVDVRGQLGLDVGGEGLDLFEQAGEHGDEGAGDRGVRVGVGVGKTAGCGG